jgi:predicted SAM-dependent methyltransferase
MKRLNVGCGSTFDPSWVNIDIVSKSSHVEACDIRQGIPYANDYFDVCYHSHVLEHLTPEQAKTLLTECWRVLKPQGVLRVVVPNLEDIVRHYLSALEQVEAGQIDATPNYDWMMLELYDQVVRNTPGGQMRAYLRKPELSNQEFVFSRIGDAALYTKKPAPLPPLSFWSKLRSKPLHRLWQKCRNLITAEDIVALVAGKRAAEAFTAAVFRDSGEIHQWMYDRFSLRRLLEQSGFVEVSVCRADQSQIENFSEYGFDVMNGRVRKPDSLFMEGKKP